MGRGRNRRRRSSRRKNEAMKLCMKQSSSSSSSVDYDLPEWLLMKILETFDSKTLCRLRLVSKGWNLIISDPVFIRPYISSFTTMATTRSLPWTLLRQDSRRHRATAIPNRILKFNRVYSDRNFQNNPRLIVSVLNFPTSVTGKHRRGFFNDLRVLASSDGLLLCCADSKFYVCNPVIKQWVAIPDHPHCFRRSVFEGLVARVDEGGIVTSYKVVLLRISDDVIDSIGVFASDTGEWTTYRASIRFGRINIGFRPICFNGILHYTGLGQLIAYDPYTDVYKHRPILLPSTSMCGVLCGVSKGRLSCISSSWDRIQVWVLEDYGTSEWLLKYTYVKQDSKVYPPFAFHPFDPTIIYTHVDTRIFACDLVRKKLFLVYDIGLKDLYCFDVLPYVLPPWPTLCQVPHGESEIEHLSDIGLEDLLLHQLVNL